MDLKVDRETGDMIFVNGSCPITTDFTDSTAQRVYIMLRTFLGEWYLNETTGVPYLSRILGHKVEKSTVDRILQEKILQEEGVADILEFTSTLDKRVYEARFRIRTTAGEDFTDSLFMG